MGSEGSDDRTVEDTDLAGGRPVMRGMGGWEMGVGNGGGSWMTRETSAWDRLVLRPMARRAPLMPFFGVVGACE
jgi:hypothetical protein